MCLDCIFWEGLHSYLFRPKIMYTFFKLALICWFYYCIVTLRSEEYTVRNTEKAVDCRLLNSQRGEFL